MASLHKKAWPGMVHHWTNVILNCGLWFEPAVSCLCWFIVVDSAVVPVSFIGEEEVHDIEWTELLTTDDQQPFSDIAELTEGLPVMAPWVTDNSNNVNFANAVIVKGELFI